jgi:hypothetical protein
MFGQVYEAVEAISGMITRYTFFEVLYLQEDCATTPKLYESITTLYAAILAYLSHAKAYFSGSTACMCARPWRYKDLQ